MVRTLAQIKAPEFDVPDIEYTKTQIEDQRIRADELDVAGFSAQAQKIREEIIPEMQEKLNYEEELNKIDSFREQGYFVINTPDLYDVMEKQPVSKKDAVDMFSHVRRLVKESKFYKSSKHSRHTILGVIDEKVKLIEESVDVE